MKWQMTLCAALSLGAFAACSGNGAETYDEPVNEAGAGELESDDAALTDWEGELTDVELMSQEEYDRQAAERIDDSNADAEFQRLQEEVGGGQ